MAVLLQDGSAGIWALTINSAGNLVVSASSGTPTTIFLNDSLGNSWQVTVATSGLLNTTSVSSSAYPTQVALGIFFGLNWYLSITPGGSLKWSSLPPVSPLNVYPIIRGRGWPVKRTPTWDTDLQQASSGRVVKLAYWTNPLWGWELTYGGGNGGGEGYVKDTVLSPATETDLAIIQGFYNQQQGRFGTFFYDDVTPGFAPGAGPWDSVTDQPVADGDGSTTVFQLIRTSGGFTEPIQAPFVLDGVSAPPTVKVNGVAQTYLSQFTIDGTGQIIFASAPGNGLPITWSGSYYWPVRFDEDNIPFDNMLQYLWSTKSIKLMQERL